MGIWLRGVRTRFVNARDILLLHQTFTDINKFFELEMFKIVPLSARLYIVDRCSYNLEPVELSEVLCARVLGPPIKRLRQ